MVGRRPARDPDWVGLGEASRLLGITPGTLRRWADEGRISVFTTPGGHRRFSRRTLRALLPADRARRPTLARLGASPERLARAYRPRPRRDTATPAGPWLAALSEADRAAFREHGRELLGLLLAHLDAEDPRDRANRLGEAEALATDYGLRTAGLGASLGEAVEGFLRFRAPFISELAAIARRRGLDTREATALLVEAEAAMDRLLVALMTGHTVASRNGGGPAARRVRLRGHRGVGAGDREGTG